MFKLLMMFCALTILFGCGPNKYLPDENPPETPSFYVPERIRVALVLGSGGVRGMAHVGVIEELEAAGIPIDLIVGCSAGSIVGALYADNPSAEAIKCAVWKLRTNSLLDINLWTCRYGLSKENSMHQVLDDHLCAETFDQLRIPLVVVAADLHSGELVPMGSGDLVQSIQASCSLPFVFVPCKYMGRVLVDGGVINPVPVKVARDLGAEIIIAVDLCELLDQTVPSNLIEILTRSAEIAFMWQNETCTKHSDVIVRPKTCGCGTFSEDRKAELYWAGKRAAKEMIPRIKGLLKAQACDNYELKQWRWVTPNCYSPQICHSSD